jgi:hypothetical protein
VPRVEAAREQDWDYSQALGATSIQELEEGAGVEILKLKALAQKLVPESIHAVPWSEQVFCTSNFAFATQQPEARGALNEYLRAVDALLVLPASGKDGKEGGPAVLLLSERECNALLELLWQRPESSPERGAETALLANLCYVYQSLAQQAVTGQGVVVQLAAGRGRGKQPPTGLLGGELMKVLVSIQLFNGETTYAEHGQSSSMQWEAMRELCQLRVLAKGRRAVAEALVGMRGKQHLLSRSQLELACDADRPAGAGL